VVRLPDGEVQIAYRQGSDHYLTRDGALKILRSTTGATTFTSPQTLRDAPGVDERDPTLAYVYGQRWITWFTGSATNGAEGAWVQAGDNPPVRIDQLPYAAIAAPVRALPDGSVAAVFYGHSAGQSRDSLWFAKSFDDGRTWTSKQIANGPAAGLDFQEPWLVVRGNQLIVAHRYGSWDRVGLTVSDDGGTTWSAPRPIINTATGRPNMLILQSGKILMSYRDATTRNGMITSSPDGGKTWAVPRVLMVAPQGPIGWTYGDFLEFQSGMILVVGAVENGADGTSTLYRFWISEDAWT
jgi:hypothetical protein